MTNAIRTILQSVTNVAGTVEVRLTKCILGSYDVLVIGLNDDAEAAIADGDDWIYSTLEQAQIAFDQLTTKWAWHGCGSAPAVHLPVSVGLTADTVATYRTIMKCGMPFEMAMRHLQRIYEANRETAQRGIDWFDNIYGHAWK